MSKRNRTIVGTYLIHNKETDETYVGSGILDEREYDHFYKLKKGDHKNKKLQEAYNKNPNFDFVPVPLDTRKEAFDAEQAIVDDFIDNPLLLNIVQDVRYGNGSGWNHSKESNEKNRIAHLGKKRSEETKEKLRLINIGNVISIETKEKMSLAHKGIPKTQEHRDKLKAAWVIRRNKI